MPKKKSTFTCENKAVNVTSMTDFKQNKLHRIKKTTSFQKVQTLPKSHNSSILTETITLLIVL